MPNPAPDGCAGPPGAPCDRPDCPLRTAADPSPAVILTGRQRELVALLAEGLTAREAAAGVGCAIGTANASLGIARRRNGCPTNAGLVVAARRAGVV